MHLRTDAVAHVVFNNAVLIAVLLGDIRLDSQADFTDLLCRSQCGNTVPHSFTSYGGQLSAGFARIANQDGTRRITMPLTVGGGVNHVRTTID